MHSGKSKKLPQVKALVLAIQAVCGVSAWALPQGANVVNGQVAITAPAAGTLQVRASNGAIINWKQFSIGAGETTQFVQPSASSAVLNRVVGQDVSQLLGQLKANGQVFLINPNGIVVGAGARIDTNSFIASTLNIADADFLAGKLRFAAGAVAGNIRNDGVIMAGPGGRIALIAPNIQNSGIIQTEGGNILLAAGRKLEIASLDLEGVTFEIQAPTDSVLNLGKLLADNGAVRAFAGSLRQSGEVRATRLVQDSDGSIVLAGSNSTTLTAESVTRADGIAGGSIVIQSATGTTRVAGQVSATGSQGTGGEVRVLGDRVALESTARIDASGSAGGGRILVGGDFQGKNENVQNAQQVYVAAGASLNADATVLGDGGRVIVWADGDTRYYGQLSARGGVQGGDGGFAEVSGKTNLEFAGSANLSASAGSSGSLLLDPLDIIVATGGGVLPQIADEFAEFPKNIVTVSPEALAAVAGNVTLQANRNIFIDDAIVLTAAGAGLTATAGGASFNAGSIFNTAGITTNAGAVTLRGASVLGAGGISTTGGAVDILTAGSLTYNGAINSGNGAVTLATSSGNVSSSNVNAGTGTIQVTAANSVSSSSYTTTGTANLTATNGNISGVNVTANTANLTATSGISASVNAGDRVNATSSGSFSSIGLSNLASQPLRVGTVQAGASSSVSLSSNAGILQASGGLITAPSYAQIIAQSSGVSSGSAGAPLSIATPRLFTSGINAPLFVAFSGAPTLTQFDLNGTVAGLGGSVFTGAGNLSLSLGAAGSVLNASAASTSGLASGFGLTVSDGSINASSLTLPGAPVTLTASNGGVAVGTMSGGSLNISAKDAVSVTSASTTGNITVSTGRCASSMNGLCLTSAPITAGSLTTTGGSINLTTSDNGDINATSLSAAGGSIALTTGNRYRNFLEFGINNYKEHVTTSNVTVGTATTGGQFSARVLGAGNLAISNPLTAGISVNIQTGTAYDDDGYSFSTGILTPSTITTAGLQAGSFVSASNLGAGSLTVTGPVSSGGSSNVNLTTSGGSITANGNLTSAFALNLTAAGGGVTALGTNTSVSTSTVTSAGPVALGTLNATNGGVTVSSSGGSISFQSINAGSGAASLSALGDVTTTADNVGADIVATTNVTVSAAAGSIGNAAFTNPLDIRSGASAVVTLTAGTDIGAAGKDVTVDTTGTIVATSSNGQFHVAATDGTTARSVSTIRLSASAAGIGSGNNSTFTSADLNVTASSDGSDITIGNLVRNTGTLNEFAFNATGSSGLNFGDVNLATASGSNKLVLTSNGPLTQTTGNIFAGNLRLDGGSGDVLVAGTITSSSSVISSPAADNIINIHGFNITTGNLDADSITVNGDGNVALGTVTSNGSNRGYNTSAYDPVVGNYPLDEIRVTAEGNLTTGNVTSMTSAYLTSNNGNVTIGGGTGTVSAGHTSTSYYQDTASLTAYNGTAAAGDLSGYYVYLNGGTVNVGDLTADNYLSVSANNVTTTAINAFQVNLHANNSLTTGTINASYIDLTSDIFATGNVTALNSLSIHANSGYAPSGVALASGGSLSIEANGDIAVLSSNSASLDAPTVTLTSHAGNVSAELTNTSNLTIDTAIGFNVSSNTWLDTVNVRAAWDMATAIGSVGASVSSNDSSSSQNFGYAFSPQLVLNASSSAPAGRNWNLTYTDTSNNAVQAPTGGGAFDFVDVMLSHAAGGNFTVNFNDGNTNTVFHDVTASLGITTSGVSTAANLSLTTGGDIRLSSIQTNGGNLGVVSNNGNITVGDISTSAEGFAGNVGLTAYSGSIENDSGPTHLIATASFSTNPYGIVTMYAPNGSIGAAGALNVSYADALNVSAHDTINIDASAAAVNNLIVAAAGSGTGSITILNPNFAALSMLRNGGNLELSGLSPGAVADFSLTATDGNLVVTSDIANVGVLGLRSDFGDLVIQASGLARSVSVNYLNLYAGHDILIRGGPTLAESVSVTTTGLFGDSNIQAVHDIRIEADGGAAVLNHGAVNYAQRLTAGNDLRVVGGSAAGISGASASVTSAGYQYFNVTNNFIVQGGASDSAYAAVQAAQSQSSGSIGSLSVLGGAGANASAQLLAATGQSLQLISGAISAQGGSGSGSFAEIVNTGVGSAQTLGTAGNGYTTSGVQVQGGAGSGAYASIRASGTQSVQSSGDINVLGGSGAGADAEIRATSIQIIGNNDNYYSDPTDNLLVQAGSGGIARIQAGSTQTVLASGNISVLGGNGSGMSASIETTGGSQTVGNSQNYIFCCGDGRDPTANILVQGGTGSNAFATIKASGFQSINAGGTISVLGNSGAGAYAEIVSTGGAQQIGSTSTSSNDATDSILVSAGSGGIARIQAQTNQSVYTGGNLSVIGGSGAGMTASIESVTSFQNIGYTYLFSNDPSGSILVQGGTGTNAQAWIKAATGQTVDAGGTISVQGGASGSSAEITTTNGSQQIGNVNSSYDQTDSISLVAGADGAYAKIGTGGSQNVYTSANLSLTGGVGTGAAASLVGGTSQSVTAYGNIALQGGAGNGAGALMLATSGPQALYVAGNLSMLGGSGSSPGANETAIRTSNSSYQDITVGGNLSIVGGGFGSDTWIKQNGSGYQAFDIGGNLSLLAPAGTPSTGVTSIESLGSYQQIDVGGLLSVDNQGGWITYIASSTTQSVTAGSLAVSVSSTSTADPFAGLVSAGNQDIVLNGDFATPGTATLTISNLTAGGLSEAAIKTDANQTILMNRFAAGLLQVGSVDSDGKGTGQGLAKISSGGDQTILAGEILLQGGAGVGSDAKLHAPDTMTISTLFGGLTMKGGVNGAASIDPTQLDIVVNGPMTLQAGTNSTANATIVAGVAGQPDTVNIAATNGRLRLIQSPAATATINGLVLPLADPPGFNYIDSAEPVPKPEPIPEIPNNPSIQDVLKNVPDNQAIQDLLALLDTATGVFEFDEDWNLVSRRRGLNQCY